MKKLVITVEPNRKGFEELCPNPDMCINGWEIIVNPVPKSGCEITRIPGTRIHIIGIKYGKSLSN